MEVPSGHLTKKIEGEISKIKVNTFCIICAKSVQRYRVSSDQTVLEKLYGIAISEMKSFLKLRRQSGE